MRDEKKRNLFIGKTTDGTYLFLEDAFKYLDDETKKVWLKGLTGFELEFLTQWDMDRRIDDYDWLELWKEAVCYWNCTERYKDWKDEVLDNGDAEMTVRDDSFCDEKCVQEALEYVNEKEEADYEYTNCVGCWRYFDDEDIKAENFEYYIEENLKTLQRLYNEYEKAEEEKTETLD